MMVADSSVTRPVYSGGGEAEGDDADMRSQSEAATRTTGNTSGRVGICCNFFLGNGKII